MTYSVEKIASLLQGETFGSDTKRTIRYLVTDSRNLVSAENSIFFALKGKRHNGHHFIHEMYEKGFRAFVVSDLPQNPEKFKEAVFIGVEDTLVALQGLAAWHRKLYQYPVIGITGSNGKTIVKEWLFQLLRNNYHIVRSPKSFNSQVGVPLSVWAMGKEHNLAIFEAGISESGEMEKLEAIISPDIGIFTTIGQAHQENFYSLEEKVIEKLKLFRNSATIIYCRDHELVHDCIQKDKHFSGKKLFTWSLTGNADLQISSENGAGATQITTNYQGTEYAFTIPFTNTVSVENAMHCFALMLHLGCDSGMIKDAMAGITQVEMRLELKKGLNDCTLINDSYNSDLGSLELALDFLNQLNQHRKKTVILSDILQSGMDEGELYGEVARLLRNKKVSRLVAIGHAITGQREKFADNSLFFNSTDEFLSTFNEQDFHNEAVLIKGARYFLFENITSRLEQKVHQTVMEIDLNAFVNNLNYYKSRLKPGVRLAVVVKAFSYGIGSWEIANLLQYHRVDYLAVAFTQEGVSLRRAGITLPIIVMNPDENTAGLMIDNNLEPEIYNFTRLSRFMNELEKRGLRDYPVHIEIDTGMHRLGFMPHEMDELAGILKNQSLVQIKSVFSHLAASEDSNHDGFTRQQIGLFSGICDKLKAETGTSFIRHILNSGGIERFPDAQFDMVRLGIGLYGVSGSIGEKLMTVATLKSTVSQLKKIRAGDTVGYSREGKPDRDSVIAIVPVGYADGLDRKLGKGRGKMLLKGKFVPTIGTICMDMCMLDVTGLDVKEGDEVIVFGKDYTISDMARELETIPYEILSSISARVKRIYLQE